MNQQTNLFGQVIEKPKIMPTLPHGQEDFEELERRVAKEYGRRHIGYPCDIAQEMSIDDRPNHIKGCFDCQELIKKLDLIAYGKKT